MPAWAASMQSDLVAAITSNNAAMQNKLTAAITANIEVVIAMMDFHATNTTRKSWNLRASSSLPLTQPLQPLLKTRAGWGPGLPGYPQYPEKEAAAASLGTEAPPRVFPANYGATFWLSEHDLSLLAAWFNDSFGIVEGDSLSDRRQKFLFFISH